MRLRQKELLNPFPVFDEDVLEGMRVLPGYLDIAVDDFKELYRVIYGLTSRRVLQTVTAAAIMCCPALCVAEGTSLEAVVSFFGRHAISGAPVLNDAGKVSGVVSEKDIFRAIGLEGMTRSIQLLDHEACLPAIFKGHERERPVSEVMTRPALTVLETGTLAEVLDIFNMKSINRIPVVDAEKTPLGIIARHDIIETFSLIHL